MQPELTQERLKELLSYEPETGRFTRLRRTAQCIRVGDEAGGLSARGYVYVCIDGRKRYAHQLAWLYMTGEWPKGDIDHINCIRSDNRIANLRVATRAQNLHNMRRHPNNVSGFKGVHFHKGTSKWRAYIRVAGKNVHLGLFTTPEAAHAAYGEAARKHFGEFARTA